MKKKQIVKIIFIFIIILTSFYLLKYFPPAEIRSKIESFGIYSPFVYVILFSVLPAFLFPVPPLALAAGILFGVIHGTIYTLIGAVINSTIMFFCARYTAKDFFENFIYKVTKKDLQKKLINENQKGLTYIFFIMRLVPLVSYNLINYLAGLTGIHYRNYIISTIIGIIPGTIIFLNMGDKLLNIKSIGFTVSVILFLLLTAISGVLLKIYLKKDKERANGNDNNSSL
ncbi:TVP38/TMEM64 family protein [Treponema pedis]|uniref:TVP38/TMEM64 family membrane protein n=2 Tax=Treponema pedis TaxID=409322 RepID=S6A0K7_9SPIR|nr:TVP38/TMEM64 family protein [Treponema pedis]AGT44233.1 integral inner membrane protein [Treponema pedis str. T A4]